MRIRLLVTMKLWRELDLEFISANDTKAVTVFMDMGLRYVRWDTKGVLGDINCIYDVVDEQKFFLSVLKYGLQYEELKNSM